MKSNCDPKRKIRGVDRRRYSGVKLFVAVLDLECGHTIRRAWSKYTQRANKSARCETCGRMAQ